MIRGIDLGQNCGIEDEELTLLTQSLVKLTQKENLVELKHLSLSSIGASPNSFCSFIKALPLIVQFRTLDLSNNAMPFFCIDKLVSSLQTIQDAPVDLTKKHRLEINEEAESERHLVKINLSGTKLDELTAFQLCQGVL